MSIEPHYPIRVSGVALGRFTTRTGPPARSEDVAAIVANFVPGTVPILWRHGGLRIGVLDTLLADWLDLRFTGTIVEYPELVARLAGGSIPVSTETVLGDIALPEGVSYPDATPPMSVSRPHFTGIIRYGRNLVGLALVENPLARGSILWREW